MFWAKAASTAGNPLYQLSYNIGAGTATTLHTYSTAVYPGWTRPIGVLSSSSLLVGLELPPSGAGNVRLDNISNTANPPVLLDRKAWVTNDSNDGIYAGSVVFAGSTNVYVLSSDNGVMAFGIVSGPTPLLAPAITPEPRESDRVFERKFCPVHRCGRRHIAARLSMVFQPQHPSP